MTYIDVLLPGHNVAPANIITLCTLGVFALCVQAYLRYWRLVAITPPGPKPIPLLGNFFDIPRERSWLTYRDWAKRFDSDLVSVRAFGQLTIIINSAKAAKELLVKRSANTSDRPSLAIIKMTGWDWNPVFMNYGEHWRTRRRLLHRALNANVVSVYRPVQTLFAHKFITKLHLEPKSFATHVERLNAGLALYVAYALEDDKYADISRDAFGMLSRWVLPGAQIVNAIPPLKYVMEWLPRTGFQAAARESIDLTHKMRFEPLTKVREQMMNGSALPSLSLSMLRSGAGEVDEEAVADVAAIIFGGGSDTTSSAFMGAIQALVLYPYVQRKAQTELDSVVGRDRLPEYADRLEMPYIEAICREVVRWHTVGPLGVPHATIEDDVYDGWFIPAGTTIIWNAWAISHDPEKYYNPMDFIPERWLDENGQLTGEEEDTGFGYGRRECVGVHFAKASLWIVIASMLSVYRFSKSKDEKGNEVEISTDRTDGFISHPVPFQCDIQPRDGKAAELLSSVALSLGQEISCGLPCTPAL